MATKETRDIYRGKAVIIEIALEGVEDWKAWEVRDLSDIDKTNAFKIIYEVAEGDASGSRHKVSLECSHRELRGKMLDYYKREDESMPTQMDMTIRTLIQQGLLPRGANEFDIDKAAGDELVGRVVNIRAYEELGSDGATWWPRCVFTSAKSLITGADKAARFAAFREGKPAPKPASSATATKAPTMPPAPADDIAVDDMPF